MLSIIRTLNRYQYQSLYQANENNLHLNIPLKPLADVYFKQERK